MILQRKQFVIQNVKIDEENGKPLGEDFRTDCCVEHVETEEYSTKKDSNKCVQTFQGFAMGRGQVVEIPSAVEAGCF